MITFFCLIFLYGAVYGVTAYCFDTPWAKAFAVCLYTACLTVFFLCCAQRRRLFLMKAKDAIIAIPLLCFAAANLCFFDGFPAMESLVTVAAGAVAEELLFRGVLLESLLPRGKGTALAVSAVLFALYHLASGGGYLQAVCAVCFGFLLAAYACRRRTVLPCVLAHLVTNLCGGGAVPLLVTVGCCVIAVVYGFWLCKEEKEI